MNTCLVKAGILSSLTLTSSCSLGFAPFYQFGLQAVPDDGCALASAHSVYDFVPGAR